MKNVVRKALIVILDQLGQLEEAGQYNAEKLLIQFARISSFRADYYEFHFPPKRNYVVPKSNFNFS